MEGNLKMQKFLKANKIKYYMTGKLIFPVNKKEIEKVHNLHNNFPNSKLLSTQEIKSKFPFINSEKVSEILHIENAGYTSPSKVLDCLKNKLEKEVNSGKLKIMYDTNVIFIKENSLNIEAYTDKYSLIKGSHLINCGGNNSIDLAHKLGKGLDYKKIEITANYIKSDSYKVPQNILVYPAPLNFSLGIHTTPIFNKPDSNDGRVYYGPSVSLKPLEIYKTLKTFGVKSFSPFFLKQLLHDYKHSNMIYGISKFGKVFSRNNEPPFRTNEDNRKSLIRAPLVKNLEFEKDFIIESDKLSTHLLNIQSPGWTSSFALCDYILKEKIRIYNQ